MASNSAKTVRLQLSRAAGFNLQALSLSVNGLHATVVTRPGPHGNPYRVGMPGVPDAATAVARHKNLLVAKLLEKPRLLEPVRGRNVACWCGLCPAHRGTGLPLGVICEQCDPCHGDTVLELANQ